VSIKLKLGKVTKLLITFTIRQILEKSHEYNISLRQLYIDLKHASDSIHWSKIIEAVKEFGTPVNHSYQSDRVKEIQ
jgi:hypothetical protein